MCYYYNMSILFVSILEASYIIYILNYFKTKYNFAHPLTYMSNNYFHHPVDTFNKPRGMICKFGRDVSCPIALYYLLRGFIEEKFKTKMTKLTSIITSLIFLGSLVNFNSTIYLMPIFIIELNKVMSER